MKMLNEPGALGSGLGEEEAAEGEFFLDLPK
jgi:hypothetical protein